MPTYASASELREWTGKTEADLPDAEAERLLNLAERDIDGLSPVGRPLDPSTGRRYDVLTLSDVDVLVLNRVTCAQAEYRMVMGDEFFIKGQYNRVDGPDYTTEGKLPRIAPAAWRELAGSGLIRFTTSTGPATRTLRRAEPDFPVRDPRAEFERG